MKTARHWRETGDGKIACELCPHGCVLGESGTGLCRVRTVQDGELRAAGYGLVSSAALDPIEKKPLYHFRPGAAIFSIGGWGCNFACPFCQNWTISQQVLEERGRYSPEKIVGMGISQVPEGRQVYATMTVMDNLLLGSYHRYGRKTKSQIHDDIEGIFALFPILKERARQKAGTLSGGEQQMLAIGRALMSRPTILLLDEPSMGLAPMVIKEIFGKIRALREEGTTILLVEQNAKAALNVADRGYVMETGKIVFQETTELLKENQEVQRAYLGKGYKEVWE